jgi:hypothetical protein
MTTTTTTGKKFVYLFFNNKICKTKFFLSVATCSSAPCATNSIIYSQNFVSGATPSSQCTAWTNFVAQLTPHAYLFLRIYGSLDSTGVTICDTTVISNIALALRTTATYGPVTSNNRVWSVDYCGSGYELSASNSNCQCTNPAYILRPCIGNANWGGINGSTCGAGDQTMTVLFQY